VVGRALQVLTAVGLFGLKLLVDQKSGVLDQNKRIRAIELRDTFTRLGPTFVKLGQGLSTRPDICPPEYLEELSELQVLNFMYSFTSLFDLGWCSLLGFSSKACSRN